MMVGPIRNGLSASIKRLLTNGGLVQRNQFYCSSRSSKNPDHVADDNCSKLRVNWKCIEEAEKYFDVSNSFKTSDDWTSKLLDSMLVYPNFVSSEEEADILKEIEPYMARLHYESSHWDDAIHNYRETERAKWNQRNTKIIDRIRSVCFPPGVAQLRFVHILDLEKTGVIKPHIDSVRFCGNTIAGLSLLSDSIMRLRHDVQKDFFCDVFLPRLSLYVMKDFARYEFTHEILGEEESQFRNEVVARGRRISVICRNEPNVSTEGPALQPLDSKS